MRQALLWALVLVVQSSGCVATLLPDGQGTPIEDGTPSIMHQGRVSVTDGGSFAPPPTPKQAIVAEVHLEEGWIRPFETIVAKVTTPDETSRVTWFLVNRNPPGAPPMHRHEDGSQHAHPPADGARTEAIAANASSSAVRLASEGRHVFSDANEGPPRLNVTVRGGHPVGVRIPIEVLQDPDGIRFAPDELVVGTGSTLVFHNRAEHVVAIHQTARMEFLHGDGDTIAFDAPRLLGDYDVAVLVRDAQDGWGEASARIIVDHRKPDDQIDVRFVGKIDLPTESQRHDLMSRHEMRDVRIAYAVTAEAPTPARLTLRVMDAHMNVIVAHEAAGEGMLALDALDAGRYRVEIEGVDGVFVRYAVDVKADLVLVAPETFFKA